MSECEMCLNYVYDDDDEEYVCEADIDEDDMAHMWGGLRRHGRWRACAGLGFGDMPGKVILCYMLYFMNRKFRSIPVRSVAPAWRPTRRFI